MLLAARTQELADPAALHRLRPPGCESHPIVLDPCNLHVNVAAATPLPSLQALSEAAERDLADMQDAESAAQASVLGGVQRQMNQLATTLAAVQVRLAALEQRPSVTLAAYLGLSDPTVNFEFELPGRMWLRAEGEVLHTVPLHGGVFELRVLCLGLGADEAGGGRWTPTLRTGLFVACAQDERAGQLLALLPLAQAQLMRFAMTAKREEVGAAGGATGGCRRRAAGPEEGDMGLRGGAATRARREAAPTSGRPPGAWVWVGLRAPADQRAAQHGRTPAT